MNTQTKAQIFLADQRGCSESNDFRSFHTFNFGTYKAEGRQPFTSLCLLNDDMLRAGASLIMLVADRTDVLLIPVVGGLAFQTALHESLDEKFLEPGQVGVLSLEAGMHFTVSNPYERESINFLQLWLTNSSLSFAPAFQQARFNFATKNKLLPIAGLTGGHLYIGQYEGRREGEYLITSTQKATKGRLFVFVLQGSFEVANRLLHEKDGLSLETEQDCVLEFEALSNDAILLLAELLPQYALKQKYR
ncbi:pirin family protein [Spirosoma aerophilum]